MKLLTKEIIAKLPKLYANENKKSEDTKIIVKFFNPCGSGTWYITEGEPMSTLEYPPLADGSNDWMFFGRCDLYGDGGELGYVMLSDFLSVKGPLGLGIERDMYYGFDHTLAEVKG